MKTLLALTIFSALLLTACRDKEPEEPEKSMLASFAELQITALHHPDFHKVDQDPAVIAATEANNKTADAYSAARAAHPDIKPLLEQIKKLESTAPEVLELHEQINSIASGVPELADLLEQNQETMISLIKAYGIAFQKTDSGKDIGTQFVEIAENSPRMLQ